MASLMDHMPSHLAVTTDPIWTGEQVAQGSAPPQGELHPAVMLEPVIQQVVPPAEHLDVAVASPAVFEIVVEMCHG